MANNIGWGKTYESSWLGDVNAEITDGVALSF